MSTAIIYHDDYLSHDTGQHPENVQRLKSILSHLKQQGTWNRCESISPRLATQEEVVACHAQEHWDRIHELGSIADSRQQLVRADPDTVVSPGSFRAALRAAGGAITAVECVLNGKVCSAFALARPPGHHSTPDRAMGFCLFNNVAIAARYAQKAHQIPKVAIIDWDVHHGNGTQEIFYADPSVFYFSVHQHPWYPGTGLREETGQGDARGTNLNVPLPADKGDADYKKVFEEILEPSLFAFKPDLIIISAGYDARQGDPLGRMRLTDEGFATLTRIVRSWSCQLCDGKVVASLEGGYNLEGLPLAVDATLREMMSEPS